MNQQISTRYSYYPFTRSAEKFVKDFSRITLNTVFIKGDIEPLFDGTKDNSEANNCERNELSFCSGKPTICINLVYDLLHF